MAFNIILRKDRLYLRRWVNCLAALFLPGAAHWTSGKKQSGIIWFVLFVAYRAAIVGLSLYPASSYTPLTVHPIEWVGAIYYILLLLGSWRCNLSTPKINIPRFIVLSILLMVLIPQSIQHYFLKTVIAPPAAMYPSLKGAETPPADSLYINRAAYYLAKPQRGDIVLFNTQGINHPQLKNNDLYLKRIVGLPGETVRIVPPNILINDQVLDDPVIFKTLSQPSPPLKGYQLAIPFPTMQFLLNTPEDSITLRENEYLVLSDNPTSPDSRNWGPIRAKNILGKAYYVCAPAERKRYIP